MVGSPSSSNLDGTGEADRCLVVDGTALTLESMGAPGENWSRRDGSLIEKFDADLFSSADQIYSPGGFLLGACVK